MDKRNGAIHGFLFLCLLGSSAANAAWLPWPLYLLGPLVIYGGIVWALPWLRRTAPVIAVGRLGGLPLGYAIVITIAASGVLIGFHSVFQPDVMPLARQLPVAALGNVIVAGVCFSVVNAVLEELVFRGVLWPIVAQEWNAGVALVVTSLLFGLFHFHGYPPGLTGAVLAGLYGLVLGLLRWWVGGLGLTKASHVCADATIFGIFVWSGAFASVT